MDWGYLSIYNTVLENTVNFVKKKKKRRYNCFYTVTVSGDLQILSHFVSTVWFS